MSRHVISNRVMLLSFSYIPVDVHTHLEEDFITLDITLLNNDQPQYCFDFGLLHHETDTYPVHPVISREFSCYNYSNKEKK